MRGLLKKTWLEVWLMTLLFGGALLAVNALLTYVVPQLQESMDQIFESFPFLRPFITAMLGTELGAEINAQTLQAFLWVHPTVLALLWAHAIVFCTRFPAGEIDRGTIDLLLGLPISRRQAYYAEVAAWLIAGAVVLALGFVGHRLVAPVMPEAMRPPLSRAGLVLMNLFCVNVAVGGLAFLVSSFSERRGRAIGVAFALVVASFLLNFVAQFWQPARKVAFLGVMEYYRPAQILQSGVFATTDVAILLTVAAASLLLGGEIVARRSICTT